QGAPAGTAGEEKGRVVRLDTDLDQRLRDEAEAAEDQRGTDRVGLDRLDAVAVVVLQPGRERDTEQGHRPRPEEHPERQARVHRAESAMPDGAEGLEDRAVEDVR